MSINISNHRGKKGKHPLGMAVEAAIRYVRREKKYMHPRKRVECKELSDAINSVTKGNYRVWIRPDIYNNAYVEVPRLSKDSPLWQEQWREWVPEYLEEEGEKEVHRSSKGIIEAVIDSKTIEHKGVAKKLPINITLSANVLHTDRAWDIDAAELTAVILHEIGHAVDMIRSIGWSVRTNYVLYSSHNALMGVGDQERRVVLLKEIAEKEGLNILDDVDEVAKLNDDKVTATVMLGAMNLQMRDEYGASCYTARGYEALADRFAAQMGYDLEIITALDKIPGAKASKKGASERSARYAIETIMWILLSAYTFGFPLMLLLAVLLYDPEQKIYDDPKERFTRVLNGQIQTLKEQKVKDPELIKRIEMAKKIVDEYADSRSLVERVQETITPSGRRTKSLRRLHQSLEEFNNNQLYVMAAKLERLGS